MLLAPINFLKTNKQINKQQKKLPTTTNNKNNQITTTTARLTRKPSFLKKEGGKIKSIFFSNLNSKIITVREQEILHMHKLINLYTSNPP